MASAGLSACSLEPPLHLPKVFSNPGYTAGPSLGGTAGTTSAGGAVQHFKYAHTLSQEWWTTFHSRRLDALVETALRNSPSTAAAQGQLKEALATLEANSGIFYPQMTGNLGASRARNSGATFGGHVSGFTYSLLTGNVGVSYYPDIFGLNRLVYKGSKAQVEYQRYELEAARLTLSGNVVDTAIQQAAIQAQITATEKIIAKERKLLMLTEAQFRAGATPYVNVLAQRGQLLANQAALPPLRQQLAVYRHLMADLMGESPSAERQKAFAMRELTLPTQIPIALPSTLVQHRPDIQAAEQQMRYARAQVGVAKAQFFPLVTLSASMGASSLTPTQFFSPANAVWSIAGALTQPIFEGGQLNAKEKGAQAAYDVTSAVYKSTVLSAFRQVADALRALEHDGIAVSVETRALRTADQEMTAVEGSFRSGAVDYLTLLGAEVTYQNARIAWVHAVAQRYQDTAALFVALGGDWWTDSRGRIAQDVPDPRKTVSKPVQASSAGIAP